ncbi:YceI family protein [Sphingomicrobium arenosum]|uniref:YceI family protein n=1 Tax=Sphingomicrobium arenosum TaxID=2233861 RepID=UPI0022409E31|nr:YceI family protein [Sphingomicrobium arenosum]
MPRALTLFAVASMALAHAAPAGSDEGEARYILSADASGVSARVKVVGVGTKEARIPVRRGAIRIDRAVPQRIDLLVELDATKIEAGGGRTERRLLGEQFFHVDHYPTVTFRGDRMAIDGPREARIGGTLTARGVTHPITLEARFDKPIATAGNGAPVTITASGTLDRRDYGMTAWGGVVGRTVHLEIKAHMLPEN